MSRSGIPGGKDSLLLLFLVLLGLAACNFPIAETPEAETQAPVVESPVESFPVDPLFQDFYTYLGGESVLGPAISPVIPFGNIQSQYLESALMMYDPMAADSDRFLLAPLGVYLGISEEPVPDPGQPEVRYSNGHIIYDEFVPFYEQLGGARFVGRPLTEARHDPAKLRIEQYFENLGIYRLQGDPPGKVRLIAYGAYSCDQRCRHQSPVASIPSLHGFLPEPFAKTSAALGLKFTGLTLSEPYRNQDGNIEVIFQNLVMILEPEKVDQEADSRFLIQLLLPAVFFDDLSVVPKISPALSDRLWVPLVLRVGLSSPQVELEEQPESVEETIEDSLPTAFDLVSFKPIVELLGLQRQPPVPQKEDPLLAFYPSGGGLGYHVPVYFDQYLRRFGGSEVAGEPIGEVFPLSAGVFRQCFTNMCLDFDPGAPAGQQLRPAPLGSQYKARFHPEAGNGWGAGSSDTVQINVSEEQAYVGPAQELQIQVSVSRAGLPLEGQALVLTRTLPDNSQQTFTLSLTDRQGQGTILLSSVNAPNGTLVPYKVCLMGTAGTESCIEDHYLIWDYP